MQSTSTQTISADCLASLSSHLRTKLENPEDAEDIAQEACFKLLQAQHRRRDIRNPKAYLYRIAYNLLYRHYTNRDQHVIDAELDVDSISADCPDIEDWTNDALRVESINRTWRELSPKCQQAIYLRWRDGLRIAEVAERMNLSRAMVKKYLARGLAHFRRRLGRYVDGNRMTRQPDPTRHAIATTAVSALASGAAREILSITK